MHIQSTQSQDAQAETIRAATDSTAPKRHDEKHPHGNRSEKQIDKAVEDSFPASDPPSTGGTTKIDPDHKEVSKEKKS
jgi:hypothetical protein